MINCGQNLINGASAEDAVIIGDKVAEVQNHFETIQRFIYSQMSVLQEMLKEVFNINLHVFH